jgi:hypothetical protein
MSTVYNTLLLAAIHGATRPLDSDDVLDAAMGLALSAGWDEAHLLPLTRKAAAMRLKHLAQAGEIMQTGMGFDAMHRQPTPLYARAPHTKAVAVPEPPVEEVPVKLPPAVAQQLERQDTLLTEMGKMIEHMRAFNTNLWKRGRRT